MATKKTDGVKVGKSGGKKADAEAEAPAPAKAKKAPAAPVKPEADLSPQAEKAAALPTEKQAALDKAMVGVDDGLAAVQAAVDEVFQGARSTRWIEKRILALRKEVKRHLDKAARRA